MKSNFVSIITLNYNGLKYLESFLNSACNLNYPEDKYEIIVVDNASVDNSVDFVKKNYPNVKIIESQKNLGFGGGNNLGIEASHGDLLFLINNDTILEKDSLKNIVNTYSRWSKKDKIGAVNAKLVLVDSYLPLTVEGTFYSDYQLKKEQKPVRSNPFVIPHEISKLHIEQVFLPFKYDFEGGMNIELMVKPFRRRDFKIFLGNSLVYKGSFAKLGEKVKVPLVLTESQVKEYKINLIQNAGNFYFRDGFGRDRGAVVYKHKQFYEPDMGQYDREELIPGFCGAGVLLNKKALDKVGLFDNSFFMYYEDGDLSFRLRENGWKILYAPKSVIRHIHAGSSKEWSQFFVYNAERGRLLFVAKHWPRFIAVRELLKYIFRDTLGVFLHNLYNKNLNEGLGKLAVRLKVVFSLLPGFVLGLVRINRLNYKEIKSFF